MLVVVAPILLLLEVVSKQLSIEVDGRSLEKLAQVCDRADGSRGIAFAKLCALSFVSAPIAD